MKKVFVLTLMLVLLSSCREEPYENPVIQFSPTVSGSVEGSEIVASASANPVLLSSGSPGVRIYYNWEISFDYENLKTEKKGYSNERVYGESTTAKREINVTEQAFIEGDSMVCKITALVSIMAKEGNDNLIQMAQGSVQTSIEFICPKVIE